MTTIFWNVDTQYDFMRQDGKLPVPGAQGIEPNLERLTEYAVRHGITVVSTADWHTPESKELSDQPDYRTTFPPHCMRETPGAAYVPATAPRRATHTIEWDGEAPDQYIAAKDIVIHKDAFDVFAGNPHTDAVLAALAPRRAIVYGVATNVCVDHAVRGLNARGIETYVVTDAIKGLPGIPSPEPQWYRDGIRPIATDDVLRGLP